MVSLCVSFCFSFCFCLSRTHPFTCVLFNTDRRPLPRPPHCRPPPRQRNPPTCYSSLLTHVFLLVLPQTCSAHAPPFRSQCGRGRGRGQHGGGPEEEGAPPRRFAQDGQALGEHPGVAAAAAATATVAAAAAAAAANDDEHEHGHADRVSHCISPVFPDASARNSYDHVNGWCKLMCLFLLLFLLLLITHASIHVRPFQHRPASPPPPPPLSTASPTTESPNML